MRSSKASCHTLLIVPPIKTFASRVFPLGLGYIAAILKKNNYKVQIIDYYTTGIRFDLKKAVEEILAIDPVFIGFTVNSLSYTSARSMIALIKERSAAIKIVVGGPHASALPKESLEDLKCDFVIVGEGEEVILEIIRRVEAGSDYFDDIKGLAFWNKNVATLNPGINLIEDLDRLPFPDQGPSFDKKNSDVCGDMFYLRAPAAALLTSRGCPHECTFCASRLIHGRTYRTRSAKNVVDEIEFLVKEHGVQQINIVDDTFSENRSHAIGICEEIIKRKIDIVWRPVVGVRVDTLDEDLLKVFKASGCYKIGLGIESFSAKILKDVKKPMTRARIQEKLALIKSFQIETLGFFILGLPKDTEESLMETIRFARDSDLDYPYFAHAVPLPGTDLFKQKYKNKHVSEIDWDDFSTLKNRSCDLSAVPSSRLRKIHAYAFFVCYFKMNRISHILRSLFRSKRIKFFKIFRFLLELLKSVN